ncbi:hypothetical protein FHP25_17085 [Vineibacter terrae]|uniref:Uncharacterized protein n=1 Tax=Vineibacter terrae TaxID=2586908 RepID=A0A5C8PLY9_9HYPH|nr:hypothetical protein [Vineibacter terrae]TXL74475.1 hypothetical protein FHP25_17085 [Vineibacter terrae]
MAGQRFTERDDRFHFAEMGDDWWATETAWFSFHHPERRLGGWLYTMARPNIGTVAGGAWVWDDSAHLPWEALYSANYSALPLPCGQDLDDCRLPTGVAIRVLEAGRCYAIGYADPERLAIDLVFDGVMPPEPLTAAGSTFGSAHHFDQFGRVTGTIALQGETIAIDCIGMRDRTWGRRPEDRPRRAAYVTGAAGPGHGFLAVTTARPDDDRVAYGFLRRDGRTVSLAAGERTVERDPVDGWVTRITLTARDAEGRTLSATGVPVSRIIINRHTFIDVNSLIRWELDGAVAWGEDQDMWPVHHWAQQARARRRR